MAALERLDPRGHGDHGVRSKPVYAILEPALRFWREDSEGGSNFWDCQKPFVEPLTGLLAHFVGMWLKAPQID